MRVALLAVVLFAVGTCVVCGANSAVSDDARSRVQAEFKQVIDGRQHGELSVRRPEPAGVGAPAFPDNVERNPSDTRSLTDLLHKPGYRAAIIAQLRSTDPMYRGLACELLDRTFDLRVLQTMGSLLDDKGKCISGAIVVSQIARWPDPQRIFSSTVGEAARCAMRRMTGISFPSTAGFNAWWKANGSCDKRLWYWSARWNDTLQYDEKTGIRFHDPRIDKRLISADVATKLSKLAPDTALKILLLAGNGYALQGELKLMGGGNRDLSGDFDASIGPDEDTIANFVKAHKLKGRLIELLQQKKLYPEVASESAYSELATLLHNIGASGRGVFSEADEPAIRRAESVKKPFPPPLSDLVLLRAVLAKGRAQTIYREALAQHPGLTDVALGLLANLGPKDVDVFVKSFKAGDGFHRKRIAQQIEEDAGYNRGIDLQLIRRLAEGQPDMDTADTTLSGLYPAYTVCSLSHAANRLAGTHFVSEDDIKSATPVPMSKLGLTDDQKAHNAGLAEATRALKSKLLAALPKA